MGRHPVDKKRNTERTKVKAWAIALLPKLQEVPLADLTIDVLAGLMGKSKSTIYQYFKSKEDIIIYVVQVHLESMASFAQILRQKSSKPVQQYQEFLLLLCNGARDIKPAFLHDLREHYPTAWELIAFFFNELVKEMKRFLEHGMELKIFRPVSTEMIARLDQFFVFQVITDPSMAESGLPLEELVRDYLTLRFQGILN